MSKTLIVGTSGAGNTHLVSELQRCGVQHVFDADDVPHLGQLMYHLYRTIYHYKNDHIHRVLKMVPNTFYQQPLILNKLPLRELLSK